MTMQDHDLVKVFRSLTTKNIKIALQQKQAMTIAAVAAYQQVLRERGF